MALRLHRKSLWLYKIKAQDGRRQNLLVNEQSSSVSLLKLMPASKLNRKARLSVNRLKF